MKFIYQAKIHTGSSNPLKQTQLVLVQVLGNRSSCVFNNTQHFTSAKAMRSQKYCVNNTLTVNRSWGFDEEDKYIKYPRCCVYTEVKLPEDTQCVVWCCVVLWGRLAALEGSSCSGYTSNYGHGAWSSCSPASWLASGGESSSSSGGAGGERQGGGGVAGLLTTSMYVLPHFIMQSMQDSQMSVSIIHLPIVYIYTHKLSTMQVKIKTKSPISTLGLFA